MTERLRRLHCSKCREVKIETEFAKRHGTARGRQYQCKSCTNARPERRQNILNAREKAIIRVREYLEQKGCVCGERDPVVLTFVPGEMNTQSVSQAMNHSPRWDRVQTAMETSFVRCYNCIYRASPRAPWAKPLATQELGEYFRRS